MSHPPSIAIPYFTGSGHTRRLAEAIAEGTGGRAQIMDVTALTPGDWERMAQADLIAFGSPTYMGSTAARFDVFLEEAADGWPEHPWSGKLAAGFSVASHPSGDKFVALTRIFVYTMQIGMVWVGQSEVGAPVYSDKPGINRDGAWIGLMATSDRDKSVLIGPDDIETARRFGARLAWAAAAWQPKA